MKVKLCQMRENIIPVERIASSSLLLRGQKVILDRELASLYGVETRALNQAVKRNSNRFPDDFMFTLSRSETTKISQFVISFAGLKFSKQVRAFNEQGVAMLSRVLNSERVLKVNSAIMRAFVKLRETLETSRELARKFAELAKHVGKHDEEIGAIIEAIRQLMTPPEKPRREIGFHARETAPRYRTGQR
jgi:ORF6N domain